MYTTDISLDDRDAAEAESHPPPPFLCTAEDKANNRKRQALFLRQSLLIADRFSRGAVTYRMLCTAIPWLEREQFDNIAVERNANGLCGYVLCDQHLGSIPKQQYRIRSARRQVYDLTERKPFCSDWCYSATRHIRKQIPSEPSWCRLQPSSYSPTITLLPVEAPTRPGRLILDGLKHLRITDSPESSPTEMSESDEAPDSSNTASDPSDEEYGLPWTARSSDTEGDVRTNQKRNTEKRVNSETSWGVHVSAPETNLVVERQPPSVPTARQELPVDTPASRVPPVNLFDAISSRLVDWISRDAFLTLTSCITEMDTGSDAANEKVTCSAFSQSASQNAEAADLLDSATTIPLVDNVSVDTIRRQLLMEQLIPRMKAILNQFDIPHRPVLKQLSNAVVHFRLTKCNVHMNPAERTLAVLALLSLIRTTPDSALISNAQLSTVLDQSMAQSDADVVEEFTRVVIKPLQDRFKTWNRAFTSPQ